MNNEKKSQIHFLGHYGCMLSKNKNHILVKINNSTLLSLKITTLEKLIEEAKKEQTE